MWDLFFYPVDLKTDSRFCAMVEELEDRDSLIELVIAMSKKIDRDRRREHSELLKKIQLCKNDLITARSLVPPSAMHNDPTVLSVRYRL